MKSDIPSKKKFEEIDASELNPAILKYISDTSLNTKTAPLFQFDVSKFIEDALLKPEFQRVVNKYIAKQYKEIGVPQKLAENFVKSLWIKITSVEFRVIRNEESADSEVFYKDEIEDLKALARKRKKNKK